MTMDEKDVQINDLTAQVTKLTADLTKSRDAHRWALDQIQRRGKEAIAAQVKHHELMAKYEPEKLPPGIVNQPPLPSVVARMVTPSVADESKPVPATVETPKRSVRSWFVSGGAGALLGALAMSLANGC